MGTGVAIASLVIGVVSAEDQRRKSKKQIRLQEEQADIAEEQARISENISDARLQESRRQQIRERRVRRARLLAQSEAQGTGGSSSEFGALSSLEARLGSNLAFQQGEAEGARSISALSDDISHIQSKISGVQSRAADSAAIGNIAGSVFQASGGFGTVFDSFEGTKKVGGSNASTVNQTQVKSNFKGSNTQLVF